MTLLFDQTVGTALAHVLFQYVVLLYVFISLRIRHDTTQMTDMLDGPDRT